MASCYLEGRSVQIEGVCVLLLCVKVREQKWQSVLSFYHDVLGVELRQLGLVASALAS